MGFDLIDSSKSGFLVGHNTSHALAEFLDKGYGDISKNRVLLIIFSDLFEAFDTFEIGLF